MSDATSGLSSAAQNLGWLLNGFVHRVSGRQRGGRAVR